MTLDAQAIELNDCISTANPHVFSLLSSRGKAMYFPRKGIIAQSAEAKDAPINATIGTALGEDGVPMSLKPIRDLVNLDAQDVFPYAPPFGKPGLRAAWAKHLRAKNPSFGDTPISKPVVTSALTHGLSMAAYLFVDPGDAVILPDLYWENYELIFELACAGSLVTYPTFTDGGAFNVEGLRERLLAGEPGKKIVLLNFPNNPTGYTVTTEEAAAIAAALTEAAEGGSDILALIDDAYFGLVYRDGVFVESMFALLAAAHPRILAVKFDGPTKEDYVWGLRVGFVTFGTAQSTPELYAALESKLGGAIRGNTSNASNPGQSLLLKAYDSADYEKEKRDKYAILRGRYEKICRTLDEHPEYRDVIKPLPFNSGYFMCVQVLRVDAEEVRRALLRDYGTAVIAFGPLLRIAFSSTPTAQLEPIFANIYRACRGLEA
jgi:aspartate/methionine/tyrosine aminotransferase